MSYVDIHSCCIRKCLRYAQIHVQYGQLYTNVICLLSFMLCANLFVTCGICCVQFAMLYWQNHSFMPKIMWHWQNYMWHWQIHLLTFTMELFLDMTLAWDPTKFNSTQFSVSILLVIQGGNYLLIFFPKYT